VKTWFSSADVGGTISLAGVTSEMPSFRGRACRSAWEAGCSEKNRKSFWPLERLNKLRTSWFLRKVEGSSAFLQGLLLDMYWDEVVESLLVYAC